MINDYEGFEENEEVEKLLNSISSNPKYEKVVFESNSIYFTICKGRIYEIPDSFDCSPKGGELLEIVGAPSETEIACINEYMKKYGIDKDFFNEVLDCCGEYYEEGFIEFFEEEDKKALKVFKKIKTDVESNATPFDSMDDLVIAFTKYELSSDKLYYRFEEEWVELYENICDTGDERGCHEDMDDNEWIEILNNIDEHIVTA